jgi:hypothetical protein
MCSTLQQMKAVRLGGRAVQRGRYRHWQIGIVITSNERTVKAHALMASGATAIRLGNSADNDCWSRGAVVSAFRSVRLSFIAVSCLLL